jgi:hypothetical protein
VLRQEAWSAEYVPGTGSPPERTVTSCSVPPAAVTVIPFAGSAAFAPFPGVMVTAGPVGVGFAVAEGPVLEGTVEAEWPAALAAPGAVPPALVFPVLLVLLPVQAVTATTSAPAANAETTRIALMPTL